MSESHSPADLIARGQSQLNEGRPDLALADFNQAIQIDPNAADAFYGRAVAHHHRQAVEDAVADLDRAIRLDPAYADAYFRRSALHRLKGDFDNAAADLDTAIQLLWRQQRSPHAPAMPEPGPAQAEASAEKAQGDNLWQAA